MNSNNNNDSENKRKSEGVLENGTEKKYKLEDGSAVAISISNSNNNNNNSSDNSIITTTSTATNNNITKHSSSNNNDNSSDNNSITNTNNIIKNIVDDSVYHLNNPLVWHFVVTRRAILGQLDKYSRTKKYFTIKGLKNYVHKDHIINLGLTCAKKVKNGVKNDDPFPKGLLPIGLESLSIFTNYSFEPGDIPYSIKRLHLSSKLKKKIDFNIIPTGVEEIKFSKCTHFQLPDNLREYDSLKTITIFARQGHLLNNLGQFVNLKKLKIESYGTSGGWNLELPNTIETLEFGYRFNSDLPLLISPN